MNGGICPLNTGIEVEMQGIAKYPPITGAARTSAAVMNRFSAGEATRSESSQLRR